MKHPKVVYLCFERLYGKSNIMSVEKTKKEAKECCRTGNTMPGSGQWFFIKYFSEGKMKKVQALAEREWL